MSEDLEAMMVRELEGQFFWCPSIDEGRSGGELSTEIRRAQRKFFVPKKKTDAEKRASERIRLEELAKSKKESRIAAEKGMASNMNFLRSLVAEAHNVDPMEIAGKSTSPRIGAAKHHFVWCLVRYYPEVSIAELGRKVGKHHSTIIHGRNSFEALRDKHTDKIAVVDDVMGYEQG